MLLKGRRKIVTEYTQEDLKDVSNVVNLLEKTMPIHMENKREIDYLVDYKNGKQTILYKEKEVRPEINNKLVINHAQMITRNIIGYFLGTPIQYIQSGANNKDEIDYLNRCVSYEDKASVDKEIAEYQSICGTGYRIIYTDGLFADEVPFEDRALNPSNTFVVYANDISEKPLAGVTYLYLFDKNNAVIGSKVYVYTNDGLFEFISDSESGMVSYGDTYNFSPYQVGGVPIIEYPNNMWRIGDWELCIGLMDAINALHSGRMDDIDQVVQSLIVFINADIDMDTYSQMRSAGVVTLNNTTGNSTEVLEIGKPLEQSGINMFSEELESMLYAMLGIPDRNSRSGGGGDTGQAVELRDGWADLEIVAKNKELTFKRSEKQALRIMLNIMNNKLGFKLSLLDVDIKFSRNKNNNLLVKTQSYATLLSTKTLTPSDCLTIVDLVSDVNEFITRGEAFWGDSFANANSDKEKTMESTVVL